MPTNPDPVAANLVNMTDGSGGWTLEPYSTGSATQVSASQLGCVLDCVLTTGLTKTSGAPTDNTAKINAYLANASASNPLCLIMDGGSATTGIIGPAGGYWTIQGIGDGSGFFILAGSNSMAIKNHPTQTAFIPGPPAPTQLGPVILKDFYVNGNSGDGTHGNSNSGEPYGDPGGNSIFYTGADILSSVGSVIENVTFYHVGSYCIRLGNCTNVQVRGCKFFQDTNYEDNDGVHVTGSSSNIFISDCVFSTIPDDNISLCSDEGWQGPINGVFISRCMFEGGTDNILRTLSYSTTSPITNIFVDQCTGLVTTSAMTLGGGNSTTDSQSNLKFSDITFQFTGSASYEGFVIQDGIGTLDIDGCTWYSPTGYAFIVFESAVNVSSLSISRCRFYLTTTSQTCKGIWFYSSGSSIGKLVIDGLSVEFETGVTPSPLPYIIDMAGGTIGELYIKSLDPTNITALVNPTTGFTGISSISGPGVLATGFNFPDSLMANGTPYLSLNSTPVGQPSIKIAGHAYRIVNV